MLSTLATLWRRIIRPTPALGRVVAIYISPRKGEPMREVREVRADPGLGLEGDRYHANTGSYSDIAFKYPVQVTLIEREAVQTAAEAIGRSFDPSESRRNIITEGVGLNDLVGKWFRIGDALFEGMDLCEPCQYLEDLTAKPGVLKALVKRGGLRAAIHEPGVIRPGDAIFLDRKAGSEKQV